MKIVVDLEAQERTKMKVLGYRDSKIENEKIIKIFNECKSETCEDCPLNTIPVVIKENGYTNVCNLLLFYRQQIENKILEVIQSS